ncbi:MAG: hypothetical protein ACE5FI_11145 [Anaerolineales bacterium]
MTERVRIVLVRWWPELLVVIFPLAYFWPLVLGTRRLFWGLPLLQFVPWRVLVRDAILSGHLPLWTDRLGMGAPLLANLQSAVFYPPNWLGLYLAPDYTLGLLAVLHLSFGALGMVRLARHLGLRAPAAVVAGFAFGFSDYFVARLWFISINNAAAWLPWIMLAADRAVLHRRRSLPQLAGLLALQLFAGHAQTTFYTLLLAGSWALWRALPARNWRGLARFAFGVTLGVAVAAVQLLPTAELLSLSERAAAAEYEFATTYSLWPWRLLSFLAPTFFGHPVDGSYWAYPTYWEDAAYIGLLPLALALYGLWRFGVGRRFARLNANQIQSDDISIHPRLHPEPVRVPALFLALIGVVSIVLALGKFTPVFPFFYKYVPGFDMFQAPARMLVGYVFAMSILAGYGFNALRPARRLRYWARLSVAAALLLALVGGWLLLAASGRIALGGLGEQQMALSWMGRALITAGLSGVLVAVLFLQRRAVLSPIWVAAAVALTVADLGLAARDLNPLVEPALYQADDSAAALRDLLAGRRVFHFPADEYELRFERLFVLGDFGDMELERWLRARAWLLPNTGVLAGVDSANNFDPLRPTTYNNYLAAIEDADPAAAANLLRAAGVAAVVSPQRHLPWPVVSTDGEVSVVAIEGAERVWFAPQACSVTDDATALALVAAGVVDPATTVAVTLAENDPAIPPCFGISEETSGASRAVARLLPDDDPNRVTIETASDAPGWLALADTDYPGWRVELDGARVGYGRANGAFRAASAHHAPSCWC